jgi:hypothetical protein
MINKIKSFLGYSWAIIAVPLAFVLSISIINIINNSAVIKNITTSSRITGGETDRIIKMDGYDIAIHKPVFEGVFSERKNGFIQVDFISIDNLPEIINAYIDYNNDLKNDFYLILNTKTNKIMLKALTDNVGKLTHENVIAFDKKRVIRVKIKNK